MGLDAGIFCETKCSKIKNLELSSWKIGLGVDAGIYDKRFFLFNLLKAISITQIINGNTILLANPKYQYSS